MIAANREVNHFLLLLSSRQYPLWQPGMDASTFDATCGEMGMKTGSCLLRAIIYLLRTTVKA